MIPFIFGCIIGSHYTWMWCVAKEEKRRKHERVTATEKLETM